MIDNLLNLLVIQSVQIGILFAIVWTVSSLVEWRRPHFVLVLWTLFFVKCMVPPIVSSPVGLFSWLPSHPSRFVARWSAHEDRPQASNRASIDLPNSGWDTGAKTNVPPGMVSPPFVAQALIVSEIQWTKIVVAVWATGVVLFLLAWTLQYLVIRHRIANAESVDVGYRKRLNSQIVAQTTELCGEHNDLQTMFQYMLGRLSLGKRSTRLLVTDQPVGPFVFGLWKPMVVVPREFMDRSANQESILAHELCHVWRRDHILSWLQLLALSLFWFHPCVWFACRKANQVCEICCDDDTLRMFGIKAPMYAQGLLTILCRRERLRTSRLAAGIRAIDVTKRRIQWILSSQCGFGFRRSFIFTCLALFAFVVPAYRSADQSIRVAPIDWLAQSSQRSLRPESQNAIPFYPRRLSESDREMILSQMSFLIGDWQVTDSSGNILGDSTFTLEKAGGMIREDWIAEDGSTAQGYSYFDSKTDQWKMSWMDSHDTLTETAGQWSANSLVMVGSIVTRHGVSEEVGVTITRLSDDRFTSEMTLHRQEGDAYHSLGVSHYHRK